MDAAVTAADGQLEISVKTDIENALRSRSFARIEADGFQLSDRLAGERRRLFTEWDHLEPDDYLHDGASFRRRRFACFCLQPATGALIAMPPESYFQSRDVNAYAGGIDRRFAPIRPAALRNRYLHELIRLLFRQLPIGPARRSLGWSIDVHQIRITATGDAAGEPTPEGPHHDGEEFGAVQLVGRRNVNGGVSTVYTNEHDPVTSLTLSEPMDTLMLWDPHVMHGVSPIRPANPAEPAIRDTLLIGFDPEPPPAP